MKTITILLTRYSDCGSSLLYYLTGRSYTHASLGLEEEPGTYYSFNYRGFCVETLEKHRRRGVDRSVSYELSVPDGAYETLRARLGEFKAHRDGLRYTRLGVLLCLLHIPLRREGYYFCSQFVAEMLQSSGACPLYRAAELYQPNHFFRELPRSSQLLRIRRDPV
ncbi:MAG: hypothetical protein ACI4LE_03915 [Faecalibacterium sp.]